MNSPAIQTIADVKKASISQLTAFYNQLTKGNLKKFSDRTSAEKRTLAAMEAAKQNGAVQQEEDLAKAAKFLAKVRNYKPEPATVVKHTLTPEKEPGKRETAENRIIRVLVKVNPRREGCLGWHKLNALIEFDGKTIAEFKKEESRHSVLGKKGRWASAALRRAIEKKWVKLENPAKEKIAK